MTARPGEDTSMRSLEVFRPMSCDALARPGSAANARGHRDQDDNRAEERAAGRRNGSGAVTASDPDVEHFLLTLQARRSPRTVDAYRRDLAALHAFAGKPVADVTTEGLEGWLASMRADGLAGSTIARRVSAVARLLSPPHPYRHARGEPRCLAPATAPRPHPTARALTRGDGSGYRRRHGDVAAGPP